MDQPLHHLRADGALLVLEEDVPPCFLGGELWVLSRTRALKKGQSFSFS